MSTFSTGLLPRRTITITITIASTQCGGHGTGLAGQRRVMVGAVLHGAARSNIGHCYHQSIC